MNGMLRFIVFSACLSAQITYSQDLIFKFYGKPKRTINLAELSAKIPPQNITVMEPHESRERTYVGFETTALFNLIYGSDWKESEEVLFTCSDGYQPSIPMLKFKENMSFVVFKDLKNPFSVINSVQNNEHVELAPFYLVWENTKNLAIREHKANIWPYQVTTIDLIKFTDKFSQTAPPPGSSAEVKEGFLAFRTTCMHCHTINGEGASKGAELNYPVSVTEYWKRDWLEKWILEPTSIRFNTTMPALGSMVSSPKKTLKALFAYLETMAKTKKAPNINSN